MENTAKLTVVKKYFDLITRFSTDPLECAQVLHPEIKQVEYPNLIVRNGQTRGFQECMRGTELGKKSFPSRGAAPF